jgi:hypothetical protein
MAKVQFKNHRLLRRYVNPGVTMKKLLFIWFLLLQACATSMSPSVFIEEFPKVTKSKYINKVTSKGEFATENCSILVENRKYIAPIGFTLKGDLSNGANGVDEWVFADKGNAYTINNFEWVSIGDQGVTQLIIYFNTLLCKSPSINT